MPDNFVPDEFDSLVAHRQQLHDFCGRHYGSVMAFSYRNSFKIYREEAPRRNDISLSSTATCYESLLSCPNKYLARSKANQAFVALQTQRSLHKFISAAFRQPIKSWKSGGSAGIYCRARTLPIIVRYAPRYNKRIGRFMGDILSQLETIPGRFAIGEASVKEPNDSYPANGFHTYWTLVILQEYKDQQKKGFPDLNVATGLSTLNIEKSCAEMIEWARQSAGYQISLHSAGSTTFDTDQLAWALSILLRFDDHFQTNLSRQDFVRQGLKCLFEAQTKIGTWRRGAPLFHYRNAGNAYCYVFETFGVLLQAALTPRIEGSFFRQSLRPHAGKLLELWRHALSNRVEENGLLGWSSGHRINHQQPESWATASVFAFAQGLRRLIGVWVREMAEEKLKVKEANAPSAAAMKNLRDRGDSWPEGGASVADKLITFFANPVLEQKKQSLSDARLEPDSQPIDDRQARAAILFGPPGASKTTLCRSVAEAIGWSYVELHASHFVAEGLTAVQRTADGIFKQLMQLDNTVILFDEIDELVRAREREPDAFGRFLTTSMLPKLAELWTNRKVIYFVATNHIGFFDSAITRAQRFDALISVPPPALERKIDRLNEILQGGLTSDERKQFRLSTIESQLERIVEYTKRKLTDAADRNGAILKPEEIPIPDTCVLAKLLLMRYDQLDELANLITNHRRKAGPLSLMEICREFSDQSLRMCDPFYKYVQGRQYDGHDFGKSIVWKIKHSGQSDTWVSMFGKFNDFDKSRFRRVEAGVLRKL